MKCCSCKRAIAAGVEAKKMIVEYVQPDGSTRFFGYLMQDGPLEKATGRILRAWHHKHYHVDRKRAARGDLVTGRVMAGAPTAYEMGVDPEAAAFVDTRQYAAKMEVLQGIARRIGKAVGDSHVMEAYLAEVNGVGYDHGHQFRLDSYQLMAHLQYAHGHHTNDALSLVVVHNQLHAQMHQLAIARVRADHDQLLVRPDWREQWVVELSTRKDECAQP